MTFNDCTYLARDDVIALIVKQFGKYARQMNIPWLSQASQEWIEHCDVMPPGAKNIEIDKWVTGDRERSEIMAAIDFVAAENTDPKVVHLMHLDDLRACIPSRQ